MALFKGERGTSPAQCGRLEPVRLRRTADGTDVQEKTFEKAIDARGTLCYNPIKRMNNCSYVKTKEGEDDEEDL